MRIQTLNRNYEILQRAKSSERMEILIAMDVNDPGEGKCMLLVFKEERDIHRFIPFCESQKANLPFDDFLDYFPRDGFLYMVLRYHPWDTLEKRLEGEMLHLGERLEIIRSLFQQMVFKHLPLYLQYEALSRENLLVDKNQTVSFHYFLREPDRFESVCQEHIWSRISMILREVFSLELENHSCPSLEIFLKRVEKQEVSGYMELLNQYETVYQELMALQEENLLKPQSFGFRLWGRIRKLFQYLTGVLFLVVVVVLLWYLIKTIRNPEYQAGEVINYQSIGTQRIVSPGESQEN